MKHVFHFSRRFNDTDAKYFFIARRKECNVAMVMVAMLAEEVSLDDLVSEFERYDDEVPRFGDYMRQAPLNIAPPVWMPLPEDERKPEYYGRETTMPRDATWQDVFAKVDAFQSAPVPPGRAPWQVSVYNGAPGGRAALVMKIHHSLSDGIALAILFAKAFAAESLAQAGAPIEAETDPPPRAPRLWIALCDRGVALRRWFGCAAELLPRMTDAGRRRREMEAMRKWLRPRRRWPLGSFRPARQLAGFRVPATVWQAEARARGGGPNELYLALVARIMRRAFDSLDFDAEPLRVAMPISLRGGRGVHDGGNVVAVSVVELAGRAAELSDLSGVRERATAAKQSADSYSPTFFEETLVALLPGSLRAALELRQGAACDVVATNIPIPIAGKVLGIPIEMMFMVAPAIGQAVSFSLTTYGDHLYFASNADRGIVSSPLEESIEETLAEVFGDRFESFHGGGGQGSALSL